MGARWLGMVVGLGLLVASPAAADPRGDMRLTWTAPGLPGQQAAAYDVRFSYEAVTTDTTSWWNAATPVTGEPVPALSGTVQSMPVTGLEPGRTVYAAIRVQYPGGAWSPVTAVAPLTLPGGPFVQGVTPNDIGTSGDRIFTLTGIGLGSVSGVRFRGAGGSIVNGSGLQVVGDGTVRVTADLGALDDGPVGVLTAAWPGEDALDGWVAVNIAGGGVTLPDTEPPATVGDLHAATVSETTVRLTWTAPADPSPAGTRRVAAYEVRRLAGGPGDWSWAGGTVLSSNSPSVPGTMETLLTGGLEPGSTYAFALTAVDSAGNVSGLSNLAGITLPTVQATIEPDAVDDLSVTVLDTAAVLLTWTAPAVPTPGGDEPVAFYELRRLGGEPGSWSWTTGVVVETGVPSAPGDPESLAVNGLTPGGTVAFAIISSDGEGEWSRISNTVEAALPLPPDTTPPAAVADLDAELSEAGLVTLSWTAPADDRGAVGTYVVKRWDGDPADFDWDQAQAVVDPPLPAAPGLLQHCPGGPVATGRVAAFALCSIDPAGNPSPLSNLALVDRTGEDLIPPAVPADLTATRFGSFGVQIRWRAPGDDGWVGRADHYELRHALSPVEEGWMETAEEIPLPRTPRQPGKVEFVNLRGLTGGVVHLFALRVYDDAGHVSDWATALVHVDDPVAEGSDAAPPAPPDSLVALRVAGGVQLSWTAVGDADLAGYCVYRCGDDGSDICIAEIEAPGTGYLDMGAPSAEVRYAVASVDDQGNRSRMGTTVVVAAGPVLPGLNLSRSGSSWALRLDEPAGEGEAVTADPRVQVFDVQGRLVAELPMAPSGNGWEANWSGRSLSGRRVSTGVFFLRVNRAGQPVTRKIVLR